MQLEMVKDLPGTWGYPRPARCLADGAARGDQQVDLARAMAPEIERHPEGARMRS